MPASRARLGAQIVLLAACAACASRAETLVLAPEHIVVRAPLDGIPTGTRADTLAALLVRRDSLDQRVQRLAQERRDAHQALVEFARNPSGDRLPALSQDGGGRGAMSDRFRAEVKAEMTATRLLEQEKLVEKRWQAVVDERDGVCSQLATRLEPGDARRCTG